MSIKYYQLAKDEELPDEFCAVRDVNGEPNEYVFYAPESENAKLRELVSELWVSCPVHDGDCDECQHKGGRTGCELYDRMRELGVGVD